MKIIILMYGHMRTYKKTYKSFNKNIVQFNKSKAFDVELYISTWDEKDIGGNFFSVEEKRFIQKIYNPKKIIFINKFDSDYQDYKNFNLNKNHLQTVNISYLLKKGFLMSEKGIDKANYALITRPDIFFHAPLDFQNIIKQDARGFQTIKTDNNIYCPYVLSDENCVINDFSQYICGIDLLSLYSKKAIKNLNNWDINKEGYEKLNTEFSLTKLFYENNVNYFQIAYEKDRCFEIERARVFPFNLIFSNQVQFFLNLILYFLYPLLIFCTKFRTKTFFNKHWLSLRSLKVLIRFLK